MTLCACICRKEKEEELRAKIQHFYKDLQYFRKQKKEQPLGAPIYGYLSENWFFYYDVQLMPDGATKENLLMLLKSRRLRKKRI